MHACPKPHDVSATCEIARLFVVMNCTCQSRWRHNVTPQVTVWRVARGTHLYSTPGLVCHSRRGLYAVMCFHIFIRSLLTAHIVGGEGGGGGGGGGAMRACIHLIYMSLSLSLESYIYLSGGYSSAHLIGLRTYYWAAIKRVVIWIKSVSLDRCAPGLTLQVCRLFLELF